MRGSSSIVPVLLLALLGCGPKPLEKKSNAELERMLNDSSPKAQAQGAYGLARHGADARHALPKLIKSLASPDVLVREQACSALGNIGPEATEAVPSLVEALNDPEWSVRRQAAVALGQIGAPAEALEEPLRKCEKDANSLVRKAAREALAKVQAKSGKTDSGGG